MLSLVKFHFVLVLKYCYFQLAMLFLSPRIWWVHNYNICFCLILISIDISMRPETFELFLQVDMPWCRML